MDPHRQQIRFRAENKRDITHKTIIWNNNDETIKNESLVKKDGQIKELNMFLISDEDGNLPDYDRFFIKMFSRYK